MIHDLQATGNNSSPDINDLKALAKGRWKEILVDAGFSTDSLDGQGHPCPRCDGDDRFSILKDFHESGAVICRHCFNKRNGDGLAAIAWLKDWSLGEAIHWLGDYLNVPANGTPDGRPHCKRKGRTYPTAEEALAALDPHMHRTKQGRRAGNWAYTDASGDVIAWVVRYDLPTPEGEKQRKTFRPVSKHGGGWRWCDPPGNWPLYRLPEVLAAIDAGQQVFVCEGEKAADAGWSIGLACTTSAHGARSPKKTDWSPFSGIESPILPDNDEAGHGYADAVAGILANLTPRATAKKVELPGLPEAGDIVDWLDGHDAAEPESLREQVEALTDQAEPIQIRAIPRETDRARIEFCPIPASQLGPGEQVEWIWDGYLARGYVTLLVGLWKAGKTTLVSHLLKALESGGDVAGKVIPAKTLIISEEGAGLWARRRDDLNIGDHAYFDIRPFKCKPTNAQWQSYVGKVAEAVARDNYDLVIVDTWQSSNPCHDENDAAGTMAAVSPLFAIMEAGAAVLLIHHPKKGDAKEGQASRGSGALTGFVDTIVELRRFSAENSDDRRRKLRGYGRFEETPAEVVIELHDDGYHLVGSISDAKRDDRQGVVAEILDAGESLTVAQILARWPDDVIPKPGKRIIQIDLNAGYDAGRWLRTGEGKKNDPYRFNSIRARSNS